MEGERYPSVDLRSGPGDHRPLNSLFQEDDVFMTQPCFCGPDHNFLIPYKDLNLRFSTVKSHTLLKV